MLAYVIYSIETVIELGLLIVFALTIVETSEVQTKFTKALNNFFFLIIIGVTCALIESTSYVLSSENTEEREFVISWLQALSDIFGYSAMIVLLWYIKDRLIEDDVSKIIFDKYSKIIQVFFTIAILALILRESIVFSQIPSNREGCTDFYIACTLNLVWLAAMMILLIVIRSILVNYMQEKYNKMGTMIGAAIGLCVILFVNSLARDFFLGLFEKDLHNTLFIIMDFVDSLFYVLPLIVAYTCNKYDDQLIIIFISEFFMLNQVEIIFCIYKEFSV